MKNGYYYLHLPTETADTFKLVQKWLYQTNIFEDPEIIVDLLWIEIFDIYLFALRRDIPGLQNVMVDVSITKNKKGGVPGSKQVNRLYEEHIAAAKVALFKQLCVDMLIRSKGSISNRVRLGEFHLQFLCAVICTLKNLKMNAMKEVEGLKKKQKKKKTTTTEGDNIDAEKSGLHDRRKGYYVQLAPIPIE